MSSTLSDTMNETVTLPTASVQKSQSLGTTLEQSGLDSSSWSWPWSFFFLYLAACALIIYLFPKLTGYLSLPEDVIMKEVDSKFQDKLDSESHDKLSLEERHIQDLEDLEQLKEKGFCYIGTDRGIRSCINVKPGDKCMSGHIFPRRDVCVNPTLRL
jgi:hypothetical protein